MDSTVEIGVGPRREQLLDHLIVAEICRAVERTVLDEVLDVQVGAVAQQHLDHLGVARHCGDVKWGRDTGRHETGVGAGFQQPHRHILLPLVHRYMEGLNCIELKFSRIFTVNPFLVF